METAEDPADDWRNARRYAEIASHLTPEYVYAVTLSEELAAMGSPPWDKEMDLDGYQPLETSSNFLYRGSGGEAAPVVIHLCRRALAHNSNGRYALARIVSQRARWIGENELGPSAPHTLVARYYMTMAMLLQGKHGEALEEIDSLLPIRTKVSGAEHPDTLTTRLLRAQILNHLDKLSEGLEEMD